MSEFLLVGAWPQLFNNIAIILALTFIYTLVQPSFVHLPPLVQALARGLLFGGFALLLPPIELAPGYFYSGRAILLLIAGLFGGWPSAAVAVSLVIVQRVLIGGVGVYAGIGSSVTAALIGVWAHRHWTRQGERKIRLLGLLGAGVALNSLVWTLLVPPPLAQAAFSQMFAPILLLYPAGVWLVAILLMRDARRVKAEADIRKERNLLHTIINTLPDALLIKDLDGRFTLSNTAHSRLLGANSPQAIIGKTTHEFFAPTQATQFEGDDQAVMASGEAILNAEQQVRDAQGQMRWLLTSKIPLKDNNGVVTGVLGISRDITERKQSEVREAELARENERGRILANFLTNAKHDLNTPLTVMITSLYLLEHAPDASRQQYHLENLKTQTTRLQKLIEDLFTMAQLDISIITEPLVMCDLNHILRGICVVQRPYGADKKLEVVLELDDEVSLTMGYGRELTRALAEVVNNAFIYTPAGGSITIRTRAQRDGAVIEVQDNGIGIDALDLPHIFERFYRADKARSTATGGSGLGLSIARKVIEAHQGTIDVQSEVGRGTTFTIFLPRRMA